MVETRSQQASQTTSRKPLGPLTFCSDEPLRSEAVLQLFFNMTRDLSCHVLRFRPVRPTCRAQRERYPPLPPEARAARERGAGPELLAAEGRAGLPTLGEASAAGRGVGMSWNRWAAH